MLLISRYFVILTRRCQEQQILRSLSKSELTVLCFWMTFVWSNLWLSPVDWVFGRLNMQKLQFFFEFQSHNSGNYTVEFFLKGVHWFFCIVWVVKVICFNFDQLHFVGKHRSETLSFVEVAGSFVLMCLGPMIYRTLKYLAHIRTGKLKYRSQKSLNYFRNQITKLQKQVKLAFCLQ